MFAAALVSKVTIVKKRIVYKFKLFICMTANRSFYVKLKK